VVEQLAARGAERIGDRDVRVEVGLVRHRDVGARHRDHDVDLKGRSVEVVAMRLLDRHVARHDAIAHRLESRHPAFGRGLERRIGRRVTERR